MTELVLDASVVLKWFASPEERHTEKAREIRGLYRSGQTTIHVPSLLFLELLNVAGRRWGWGPDALDCFAEALDDLGFQVGEADLRSVAVWVARGLTAYDAAYVALAESLRLSLVTDDERILAIAGEVAVSLAGRP